jgi:hypothetical protein
LFLGAVCLFAPALPASAQQYTTSATSSGAGSSTPSFFSSMMSHTSSSTNNATGTAAPSFFSGPLAKLNFAGMYQKPTMPTPITLSSLLPTFPNLQNNIMLRNTLGTQATIQMPRTQAPPPPTKKKGFSLFQ